MQNPPLTTFGSCVGCHQFNGTACRKFTDQSTAFTFAVNGSVGSNPNTSVFLKMNLTNGCSGGCTSCTGATLTTHSGGNQWSTVDAAGNTAVSNWITGGKPPEPLPLHAVSSDALQLIKRPNVASPVASSMPVRTDRR